MGGLLSGSSVLATKRERLAGPLLCATGPGELARAAREAALQGEEHEVWRLRGLRGAARERLYAEATLRGRTRPT